MFFHKLPLVPRAAAIVLLAWAAAAQQEKPSLWVKLLRFAGVSYSPAAARGDSSAGRVEAGSVMVVSVNGSGRRLIAGNRYYRWPVFGEADKEVFALSGDEVWALPIDGPQPARVRTAHGIQKLVGYDASTGELLVLTGTNGLASLSFQTGKRVEFDIEEGETAGREMLRDFRGVQRVFGDWALFASSSGEVFEQVYLRKARESPAKLTDCSEADCGQPSLSRDRARAVYISQPWIRGQK
jgi:hypothetical protein